MKKLGISVAVFAILVIAIPPYFLGFSIFQLGHTLQVASSMTAKLACSAKFISGFSDQQIIDDVASYSPATKLVDIDYDYQTQRVSTDMLGLSQTEAQYVPGLGCHIVYDDFEPIHYLAPEGNEPSHQLWPAGDSVQIDASLQALSDAIVAEDNLKGFNTRALLVVHNGQIVAESYAQQTDVHTPLLGWSMAKSVTSMMIGAYDLQHPVDVTQNALFSAWQGKMQDISLYSLLTMTSGLYFAEEYAPGSDATKMLFTSAQASDLPLKSPIAYPLNSHFSYSSGTSNLLAQWLHTELGSDVQRSQMFLQEALLKPASITSLTFETDASGVMIGSSYVFANGRDWARLGQIMVGNGAINGQQLIKAEWVQAAQQPNRSDNEKSYGYQFWLNRGDEKLRWPSLPEDAFAMLGSRKQSVMMIPSKDVVLVRLGWSKGEYPMEENYAKLLVKIDELAE